MRARGSQRRMSRRIRSQVMRAVWLRRRSVRTLVHLTRRGRRGRYCRGASLLPVVGGEGEVDKEARSKSVCLSSRL